MLVIPRPSGVKRVVLALGRFPVLFSAYAEVVPVRPRALANPISQRRGATQNTTKEKENTMSKTTKYGIYLTSALIVTAVGAPPLLLVPIALLALLTWKENK
ncbi:hypothetical protein [Corynebacterium pseudotuberculosis]|uniref:hypothetical protein n=1 Tax=Corynebacterium pseudotuberculosis TaxID=1719 RepID=UPI0009B63D78|nr:hypothetical protein [Corynebacterium pseudotuberculosis]